MIEGTSFATGLFLGMTVGFMGGVGSCVGIIFLAAHIFKAWARRQ